MSYIKEIIFYVIVYISYIQGCNLTSNFEGECKYKKTTNITFCYDYISDRICVPYISELYKNHSSYDIDRFLEEKIMNELRFEFKKELDEGNSYMPIINNPDCWKNYIKFICRSNFRSCIDNDEEDFSFKVCSSYCFDYKTACGLPTDNCSISEKNDDGKLSDLDFIDNSNSIQQEIERKLQLKEILNETEKLSACQ